MSEIRSNQLWLARKRLGYEQKQIASLLGHKTTYQISRYETGQRIPSLKIALKFSIIYNLPVRVLFHGYHAECRNEINNRLKNGTQNAISRADLTEPTDYCSYIEMMKGSFMTDIDKTKIKKHILMLMNDRRTKVLGH